MEAIRRSLLAQLVAGPPAVQRIFELTGTTERLNFVEAFTSRDAA